jgi:uncharacterized protein YfeS
MDVSLYTRSARTFGGNTTYFLVGEYLKTGLGTYGSAIATIELTACFSGGKIGHSSLKPAYDRFHSDYLPSLPACKFYRKKAKIEIAYETRVTDAHFLERRGFLSVDYFSQAMTEAADKLHLVDTKLKRTDEFDLFQFHQHVNDLVNCAPHSDDELRELKSRLESERQKRIAALGPWERLDIKWDDFHPTARVLLNDPFLWNCVNDYAPHGNDTGADLLAAFKKWNKSHSTEPAFAMAVSLLKKWGIPSIEYSTTSEVDVMRLMQNDSITLQVTNESMIAVAFASIKHRGCCDEPTLKYALNAIARQKLVAGVAKQSRDVTEWLSTLDKLVAVLQQIPYQPIDSHS